MTAHMAHTEHEHGTGHECGDRRGVAGGAEGIEIKSEVGLSGVTTPPAPAGRMNLTYLVPSKSKFQKIGWFGQNMSE